MFVNETNRLTDEILFDFHTLDREPITLRELADARGQVTRVRMYRDHGIHDIAYIYGELPDGTLVRISDLPSADYAPATAILLDWAESEGVYAKGVGLLNRLNWSVLG